MKDMTLNELRVGERARITKMNVRGGMRRRMQDIGFLEGAEVSCMLRGRSGEPGAFLVCGALIALREEEMKRVSALRITEKQPCGDGSGCRAWD